MATRVEMRQQTPYCQFAQVRVLVATAVHAAQEYPDDPQALLRLATSCDQHVTAPAAPAEGLLFVEAGYSEWETHGPK